MLLDNGIHGGQPQPRALAHVLGGEKGFENPGQRGLIHALAGVSQAEVHIAARRPLVGPAESLGQRYGLTRQGHVPLPGHGLPGIDQQVEYHLLHLTRVHFHRGQIRGQLPGDGDTAPGTVKQPGGLLQEGIEVDGFG